MRSSAVQRTSGSIQEPEQEATLSVQVRAPGGRLRDAGGLSHGTTEQVYLLLRVALADRKSVV